VAGALSTHMGCIGELRSCGPMLGRARAYPSPPPSPTLNATAGKITMLWLTGGPFRSRQRHRRQVHVSYGSPAAHSAAGNDTAGKITLVMAHRRPVPQPATTPPASSRWLWLTGGPIRSRQRLLHRGLRYFIFWVGEGREGYALALPNIGPQLRNSPMHPM
jgi:hypothetical protein